MELSVGVYCTKYQQNTVVYILENTPPPEKGKYHLGENTKSGREKGGNFKKGRKKKEQGRKEKEKEKTRKGLNNHKRGKNIIIGKGVGIKNKYCFRGKYRPLTKEMVEI